MTRKHPLPRFKRCLAVTRAGKICKLPRRVGVLCWVHERMRTQVVVNPKLRLAR